MKNFFKKVIDFIKEAVWIQPILCVALILVLILGIQGIGNLVGKAKTANWGCGCNKDNVKMYNKVLAEDVVEMIENEEDFVLYIGYETCSGCAAFEPVLKRYAKDYPNEKVYYLSIQQNEDNEYKDATLTKDVLDDIYSSIKKVLHEELATPPVAAFKDGVCVDAKVGGGQNGISVSDLVDLQEQIKETTEE